MDQRVARSGRQVFNRRDHLCLWKGRGGYSIKNNFHVQIYHARKRFEMLCYVKHTGRQRYEKDIMSLLQKCSFLVCRNFLTGSCIYGSSCRYDHIPQTWVFRNLEKVGFPIDNEASKGEPETAASHVDLNDRTQTSASTAQSHNDVPANVETVVENGAREEILCGYYVLGNCPFGENCKYVHGDMCELCKRQILRPGDDAYKLMHQQSRNSN
ncbi:putative E3 ubiquitin-protein ligase [Trichinella pseudospiralis]